MDKEYEEGRRSFFVARGEYQNPHPAGSPAFNRFEAGWKQELNLHPDLFREYQRQKRNEEQRAIERKNLEQHRIDDQKNREARRSAEAYRKAKGR